MIFENNKHMKFEILKPYNPDFEKDAAFIKANIKELCKGLVTRTYIAKDKKNSATGVKELSALHMADAIMLAYSEKKTRHGGKRVFVTGFAILNHQPANGVYIDVICAKGYGKQMIEHIEKYAKAEGKAFVHLSALPHVINYYRKLGFVHSESDECKEHHLVTKQAEKVKSLRFGKKKIKGVVYTDAEMAVKDQKFDKLLKALVRHGYTKDKTCRGTKLGYMKFGSNVDGTPNYVNGCSVDGYIMRKCL